MQTGRGGCPLHIRASENRILQRPAVQDPARPRLRPRNGRRWVVLLGLLAVAAAGCGSGAGSAQAGRSDAPAVNQPTTRLSGVRTEVTQRGKRREWIEAEQARLEENDGILHFSRLALQLLEEGTINGAARGDEGTLWLSAREDRGIGRNDIELRSNVVFDTGEGMLLASPLMRYSSAQSLLWTDDGFTLQLGGDGRYMIGHGRSFELKLFVEEGAERHIQWTGPEEAGEPFRLTAQSEPVIRP